MTTLPADELVERLGRIADQMERFLGPPEMAPGPDPDDLTDAKALIEAQAAEISSLRAKLAEAMERIGKDSDRLDFLDECNRRLNAHYGTNYRWELILNHNVNRLMIDRLAIDLNDAKAHGWKSCRDVIDREMLRVAASRHARAARRFIEENGNG